MPTQRDMICRACGHRFFEWVGEVEGGMLLRSTAKGVSRLIRFADLPNEAYLAFCRTTSPAEATTFMQTYADENDAPGNGPWRVDAPMRCPACNSERVEADPDGGDTDMA